MLMLHVPFLVLKLRHSIWPVAPQICTCNLFNYAFAFVDDDLKHQTSSSDSDSEGTCVLNRIGFL